MGISMRYTMMMIDDSQKYKDGMIILIWMGLVETALIQLRFAWNPQYDIYNKYHSFISLLGTGGRNYLCFPQKEGKGEEEEGERNE